MKMSLLLRCIAANINWICFLSEILNKIDLIMKKRKNKTFHAALIKKHIVLNVF